MAQLLEYFKMAIDNLRANKGRSFLTMLGIIIGISSVIMIMAIGSGVSSEVTNELNSIAGGQVVVYMNESKAQYADYITQEDMDAMKEKIPFMKGISCNETLSGTALASKGDFNAMINGGTEDLQYFLSTQMVSKGRFFTRDECLSGRKVCLIDETDAIKMFGTSNVIGMTIETTMWNITQELEIIGTLKTKTDGMLSNFYYSSDSVTLYVPYTMLQSGFGADMESFYMVYAIANEPSDDGKVVNEMIKILESRHKNKGNECYLLQKGADQISSITSVLNIITVFIIFVAAISLLVGGVGVMNIMLVSVTERTREIGIRKSLGAKTRSIMLQFLSESAIITLIGGIIGIILGISGAYAVCSLPVLGITPKISATAVIMATLFSSSVGIFFGIYPAKKAAKLSPIEALRRN